MERLSFLLFALLLILCPFGVAGHATHNFEPIPADLFDLGHWDYDTWGVGWAVPAGENTADMNSEPGFQSGIYCRNDGIDPGSETAQERYYVILFLFATGLFLIAASGKKFRKR
jgi:hypothetical protein